MKSFKSKLLASIGLLFLFPVVVFAKPEVVICTNYDQANGRRIELKIELADADPYLFSLRGTTLSGEDVRIDGSIQRTEHGAYVYLVPRDPSANKILITIQRFLEDPETVYIKLKNFFGMTEKSYELTCQVGRMPHYLVLAEGKALLYNQSEPARDLAIASATEDSIGKAQRLCGSSVPRRVSSWQVLEHINFFPGAEVNVKANFECR